VDQRRSRKRRARKIKRSRKNPLSTVKKLFDYDYIFNKTPKRIYLSTKNEYAWMSKHKGGIQCVYTVQNGLMYCTKAKNKGYIYKW